MIMLDTGLNFIRIEKLVSNAVKVELIQNAPNAMLQCALIKIQINLHDFTIKKDFYLDMNVIK